MGDDGEPAVVGREITEEGIIELRYCVCFAFCVKVEKTPEGGIDAVFGIVVKVAIVVANLNERRSQIVVLKIRV